jgi:hypothetical protein
MSNLHPLAEVSNPAGAQQTFRGWSPPPARLSIITPQARKLLNEFVYLWKLAAQHGDEMVQPGMAYLSRKLGLGRTRTHVYVRELERVGYVTIHRTRGQRNNRYSPGPRLKSDVRSDVHFPPQSEQQSEQQTEHQSEHHFENAPLYSIQQQTSELKNQGAAPEKPGGDFTLTAPGLAQAWCFYSRLPHGHRERDAVGMTPAFEELLRRGHDPRKLLREVTHRDDNGEHFWKFKNRVDAQQGAGHGRTQRTQRTAARFRE